MEDLKCCLLGLESASFHLALSSLNGQEDVEDEWCASSDNDENANDHNEDEEQCKEVMHNERMSNPSLRKQREALERHSSTPAGANQQKGASFFASTPLPKRRSEGSHALVPCAKSSEYSSSGLSSFGASIPPAPYFPQFVMSSLYRTLLHPVELDILQQLLPLGSAYSLLRQFVQNISVGKARGVSLDLYASAVGAGIRDVLHEYYIPEVQNLHSPSSATRLYQRYQIAFSLLTEIVRTQQELSVHQAVLQEKAQRVNASVAQQCRGKARNEEKSTSNENTHFTSLFPSSQYQEAISPHRTHSSSTNENSVLRVSSLPLLLRQLHDFISHREVPVEFREGMGKRVWLAVLYAIAHFVAHGVVLRSHAQNFFIRLRPSHEAPPGSPCASSPGGVVGCTRCHPEKSSEEEEEAELRIPSSSPRDTMEFVFYPHRLPFGFSLELGMAILQAGKERRMLLMETQLGASPSLFHRFSATSISTRGSSTSSTAIHEEYSGYLESLAFSAQDQAAQWVFEKVFSQDLLVPLSTPQDQDLSSSIHSSVSIENSGGEEKGRGGKLDTEKLAARIHEVKSFWSRVLWDHLSFPVRHVHHHLSSSSSFGGTPASAMRRRERREEAKGCSLLARAASPSSSPSWTLCDRIRQVQDLFFLRRGDVWATFIHLILPDLWEGVTTSASTSSERECDEEGGCRSSSSSSSSYSNEDDDEEGGSGPGRMAGGIRTVISSLATEHRTEKKERIEREEEEGGERSGNPMMKVLPTSPSSPSVAVAFTPAPQNQDTGFHMSLFMSSVKKRSRQDTAMHEKNQHRDGTSSLLYDVEKEWRTLVGSTTAATAATTSSSVPKTKGWWYSARQRRGITEAFQTALRQVGWATTDPRWTNPHYPSSRGARGGEKSLRWDASWASPPSHDISEDHGAWGSISSFRDSFALYIPETLEDIHEGHEDTEEGKGLVDRDELNEEEAKRRAEKEAPTGGHHMETRSSLAQRDETMTKNKTSLYATGSAPATSSRSATSGSIEEGAKHFLARVKAIQLQYIPSASPSAPAVSFPSSSFGSIALSGGGVPLIITPPVFLYYQRIFQFLLPIHVSIVSLQSLRPAFSEAMSCANRHPSEHLRQALALYHSLYYILHTFHQYIQVDVVDPACRAFQEQLSAEDDEQEEDSQEEEQENDEQTAEDHLVAKGVPSHRSAKGFYQEEVQHENRSATLPQRPVPSSDFPFTSTATPNTRAVPFHGRHVTSSWRCRSLEDAQRCHHQCLWKILQGTFLVDAPLFSSFLTPPTAVNTTEGRFVESVPPFMSESAALRNACEALCECACTFVMLCQRYRISSWAIEVPSSPSASRFKEKEARQRGSSSPPSLSTSASSIPSHSLRRRYVAARQDSIPPSVRTVEEEDREGAARQRVSGGVSSSSMAYTKEGGPQGAQHARGHHANHKGKDGARRGSRSTTSGTIILRQRGNMLVRETPIEVKACLLFLQTQLHQRVVSVLTSFLLSPATFLSTSSSGAHSPYPASSSYPSPTTLVSHRALWTRLDFNRFFSRSASSCTNSKTGSFVDPSPSQEKVSPITNGSRGSAAASPHRTTAARVVGERRDGRSSSSPSLLRSSLLSLTPPSASVDPPPSCSTISTVLPSSSFSKAQGSGDLTRNTCTRRSTTQGQASSSSPTMHHLPCTSAALPHPSSIPSSEEKDSQAARIGEKKKKKNMENEEAEKELSRKLKKNENGKEEEEREWRSRHAHQKNVSPTPQRRSSSLGVGANVTLLPSFVRTAPSSYATLLAVAAADSGGTSEEKRRNSNRL